jgi:lipopolysaccharide transport protein LptA
MLKKTKTKKIRSALVFKRLTLLLLVLVIVVIGVDIISRSGQKANVSLSDEELKEQKVEQREDVLYLEDEKGRPVLESKADRQYLGEDGFYHLEGDVWIRFLKRAEGEDVVFRGNEILHDREGSRFVLKENAVIQFKDLLIESSYLEYKSKERVMTTDKGVSFSSDRIKGRGQNMICWEREKEIKIQDNVDLELIQDDEGSKVIHVSGDELFYTQKWGNGYMDGHVKVKAGQNSINTERMEFYLPPDRDFLRSMNLKGSVRGDLFLESSSKDGPKVQEYKAEAEGVFIRFFKSLDIPQSIAARGNCLIEAVKEGMGFRRIRSDRFAVGFSRDGEMKEFSGADNVIVEENEGDDIRLIKGHEFSLDSQEETLTVFGWKTQRAEVSSGEYEISADEISSGLDESSLEAKGEITGVFLPSENSKVSIGIFSSSQPVFISSDTMRYLTEQDRFIFKGKVKLWQEQEMLNTEELIIGKEGGELTAVKGVQTIFGFENSKGEKKNIKITSNVMEFNPQDNKISYMQECSLDTEKILLNAESISILMKEGENELEVITAKDTVTVKTGEYEARGEKAVYTLEDEKMVLTGKPVLIEENGGRTNGDKLTFIMADDRIIVENRGDQRSVTVIKK